MLFCIQLKAHCFINFNILLTFPGHTVLYEFLSCTLKINAQYLYILIVNALQY